MKQKKPVHYIILPLLFTIFLGGCGEKTPASTGGFDPDNGLIVSGIVETEEVDLNTKIPGKITKIYIEEGQEVQAGDLIAEIDNSQLLAKKAQVEAQVKAAKEAVELQSKIADSNVAQAEGAYKAALAQLEKAKKGARSQELEQAKTYFEMMQKTYERVTKLYEKGAVSPLWGLVGAVAHFPIILLAAVSLNGSGHKPSPGLVAGKIAAYSLLGCAEMLLSLAVAFLIYPLTFKGSLWALLLIAALFVLAIVSLGLMLSAALPSQVTASQAAIVVALPALILSGYTWPLSQIPWSIRILGEIEPLTYFVNPLRELALSGAVTPLYRQGAAVLGAMAVAFYLLTCLIIFGKKGCSWKKAPLAN